MNLLEGKLLAEGQRIGVVAARFNEFITAKLVGGAKDAFVRHGGDENKLDEATKGVAHVGLQTGVPVIFGILTTDSIEQAVERAGTKAGNKGFDAMTTAIEMINLLKQI